MTNNKGFSALIIILVVIVAAVLVAVAIWSYTLERSVNPPPCSPQQCPPQQPAAGSQGNSTIAFTASPASGTVPLNVQFTESAPQGTDLGNIVNFGDNSEGRVLFAPVCSSCNALGIVSHTYTTAGIFKATLINSSGTLMNSASITVASSNENATASPATQTPPSQTAPIVFSITYKNPTYGFTFSLPADWQGYSVMTGADVSQWQGYIPSASQGDVTTTTGPEVVLKSKIDQEIPILILTKAQWNEYLAGDFHISPSGDDSAYSIGQNNRYVFALPPEWTDWSSTGTDELMMMMDQNPLRPFNL